MSSSVSGSGRRWLGYRSGWFALGTAVVVGLANSIWVFLDRQTPAWDQASYLSLGIRYADAFGNGGPGTLIRTMHALDPARGPLFVLGITPLLALFGSTSQSALLLNVLAAPVLLASAGEIAATVFRSWSARLLAIVLVGLTPIIVGLMHNVLVDFLLATLTTVAVLALLKCDTFAARGWSVLLGVVVGLGILTKVTFPAFVLGPALVVLARLVVVLVHDGRRGSDDERPPEVASARTRPRVVPHRRRMLNLALALGVAALLSCAWYVPNLGPTMDYIRSTTGGPLSAGAGPSQPLTLYNLVSFALGVVNQNLSWILVLAGVIAVVANLRTLLALVTPRVAWAPLADGLLVLSWVVIPYLSVTTAHNQDVRLMAPAFVGFSILVAGGLAAVRLSALRRSLTAVVVVLLAFQVLNRLVPIEPRWLPSALGFGLRSHRIDQPLASSETLGYLRLPQRDRGTAIMDYVERRAPSRSSGAPRTLCVLASYPVVNGNTFGFLDLKDRSDFTVLNVQVGLPGQAPLGQQLRACDAGLYVPPPSPAEGRATGGGQSRVDLVNRDFASASMTPRLLRLFAPRPRVFPVGEAPRDTSRFVATQPGEVVVLLRRTGDG